MKILAAVGSAIFLLAFSNPALAAAVTSYEPSSIVSALQGAGYKALLTKDDDGDPKIETAAGGGTIIISFVSCTKGKECSQIEFIEFWDCDKQVSKCKATISKLGAEESFAHLIMTKDLLALYRHMLFDKAGVSADLFLENFLFFARDADQVRSTF